jgi:hypothetical protein
MKKIAILTGIICCALLAQGCSSCSREMKSLRSDFSGGLTRRAVLMDYTGDTIKVWEGKFDIRDQGSDNQIFFDLDDKRVWIQGGIFVSEEL